MISIYLRMQKYIKSRTWRVYNIDFNTNLTSLSGILAPKNRLPTTRARMLNQPPIKRHHCVTTALAERQQTDIKQTQRNTCTWAA